MIETIAVLLMIAFNVGLYTWFNNICANDVAMVMKR